MGGGDFVVRAVIAVGEQTSRSDDWGVVNYGNVRLEGVGSALVKVQVIPYPYSC